MPTSSVRSQEETVRHGGFITNVTSQTYALRVPGSDSRDVLPSTSVLEHHRLSHS